MQDSVLAPLKTPKLERKSRWIEVEKKGGGVKVKECVYYYRYYKLGTYNLNILFSFKGVQ